MRLGMRSDFSGTRFRILPEGFDSRLAAAFLVLALAGLATLWSASMGYAISMGRSPDYFAGRQIIFLAISSILFFTSASISLKKLRAVVGPVTIIVLITLLLPYLPIIGNDINGAHRWINLRFTTVQPSELWKTTVVFYLAHVLDKRKDSIHESVVPSLAPFALLAAGSGIIFFQNDFSTAALALAIGLIVFWVAGVQFRFFIGIGALVIPMAVVMVATSEYRLSRIIGFLAPKYDPHGMNYQVMNSVRAISSGGLLGKGLGLGTRKLASIPEVQSDFVFAAFMEEMGILGLILVMACWGFVVYRVVKSLQGKSMFEILLGTGLVSLLAVQFLVNLAVVSGLVPATGIALPFFSAGGSSLMSTALTCGLILNVTARRGFEPVSEENMKVAGGIVHG
jgi:cell division protein FtsW